MSIIVRKFSKKTISCTQSISIVWKVSCKQCKTYEAWPGWALLLYKWGYSWCHYCYVIEIIVAHYGYHSYSIRFSIVTVTSSSSADRDGTCYWCSGCTGTGQRGIVGGARAITLLTTYYYTSILHYYTRPS